MFKKKEKVSVNKKFLPKFNKEFFQRVKSACAWKRETND